MNDWNCPHCSSLNPEYTIVCDRCDRCEECGEVVPPAPGNSGRHERVCPALLRHRAADIELQRRLDCGLI